MSRVLPILFNTEMVQAILDGRKTVTRRAIKPKHRNAYGFEVSIRKSDGQVVGIYDCDKNGQKFEQPHTLPYVPGDILYVRETWAWEPCWDCGLDTEEYACPYEYERIYNQKKKEYGCYCYRASMEMGEELSVDTWHPSIHMPKAAARIWLKVTEVRVERLQDIDDDGIVAEGLQIGDPYDELWNSTIQKNNLPLYGWDANPWVWVIEFERCGKPDGWQDGI